MDTRHILNNSYRKSFCEWLQRDFYVVAGVVCGIMMIEIGICREACFAYMEDVVCLLRLYWVFLSLRP